MNNKQFKGNSFINTLLIHYQMEKFNELFETGQKATKLPKKDYTLTLPWVDKYRPKKLADVVHQDEVVRMLKQVLVDGELPHLLLYGPPGVGKTSIVLAIAAELFGPRKFNERVIELNASDERGINVVRNKIVTLAKMSVSARDENYLCPSYKIIILDEADAMTTEAQSALRKTMEDHAKITRFCFICNYPNQIIDSIVSRCVKFRFKPINKENAVIRLEEIAIHEKMNINKGALETIATVTNGDMRKAIMLLQNLNYLNKKIECDDVFTLANIVPTSKIIKIINICSNKNTTTNKLENLVNEFSMSGYPLNILLSQLVDHIAKNNMLTEKQKSYICYHIATTEKRLIDGSDEYLQLFSVFMCIHSVVLGEESVYNALL